jgi:HlyD family secretion protein
MFKSKGFWFTLVVLAGVAAGGAWYFMRTGGVAFGRSEAAAKPAATGRDPQKIACLGRIEPGDGIVSISTRGIPGQPSIIERLNVHEGDLVKTGEVVAVLDSRRQLEDAIRSLEAQVKVAQNRVEVVRSGPRKGDLAAQQAEIARLEATLAGAQIDAARYDELYEKRAATVIERDQRRLQVETARQAVNEARSRLQSLQEIRDVDVQLAEAEVVAATTAVEKARTELEASSIRAPFSGRVLTIHAHPGEEIGPRGVIEIGRTDKMYVIAEVFESDVPRVKVGQNATITSEAFSKPWSGVVESIGSQVAKGDIDQTNPVSITDARVVDVKIRLADSSEASRLIHGKVTAVIEP